MEDIDCSCFDEAELERIVSDDCTFLTAVAFEVIGVRCMLAFRMSVEETIDQFPDG